MRTSIHSLLSVLCVAIGFESAGAQSVYRYEPFRLPQARRTCTVDTAASGGPRNSVRIKLAMADGSPLRDDRDIEATYDSAHKPISLALLATELVLSGDSLTARMRPYLVWFGPNPGDTTFALRQLGPEKASPQPTTRSADSSSFIPPGWERVSTAEVEKAETLMKWLVAHECLEERKGQGRQ